MYDGPDGGPTTTEQGHRRYTPWRSCTSAPVHNGELYWILRTDMQTIVRRMKALEPGLFSPAHPDAY